MADAFFICRYSIPFIFPSSNNSKINILNSFMYFFQIICPRFWVHSNSIYLYHIQLLSLYLNQAGFLIQSTFHKSIQTELYHNLRIFHNHIKNKVKQLLFLSLLQTLPPFLKRSFLILLT